MGTPEFMSPEQASGDQLDGRSDLYSLSLVVWFALTGELAISGENTQKVLVKQLTEAVPPIGVRRTDVPLPVRLFAEEANQATLIVAGAVVFGTLLLLYLTTRYEGNIDIILPMVLVVAALWGRLAQTMMAARRLARRGFRVDEVQRGFATIVGERNAERAQLRADETVVGRRRRQVIFMIVMFSASFAMREYVFAYQRWELRPGWFNVSRVGAIIRYSAMVMRGIAIVALLTSPLRQSPIELLFRQFWMRAPGRVILRVAARGLRVGGTGRATTGSSGSAIPPIVMTAPVMSSAVPSLESRVAALERWRESRGGP